MAILKLYNDERVVELLNDETDTDKPYDSWYFGLETDKTLFRFIEENNRRFWRSLNIRYNTTNNKFYVNNLCHEDGFEIELNFDEDIFKYFMVDTESIINFEEMIESNN